MFALRVCRPLMRAHLHTCSYLWAGTKKKKNLGEIGDHLYSTCNKKFIAFSSSYSLHPPLRITNILHQSIPWGQEKSVMTVKLRETGVCLALAVFEGAEIVNHS